MSLENNAWVNLFLVIIKENGYYEKLRYFKRKRGFSFEEMARMLNDYYEYCPDGMSPYYYMDSLEDYLMENSIKGLYDINDIVEAVCDNYAWKE